MVEIRSLGGTAGSDLTSSFVAGRGYIARAWAVVAAATLLALAAGAQASPSPDTPPGWRLEKVVMVLRHGIRAGTKVEAVQAVSAKAWPAFDVAPGMLTTHGAQAIARLGAWQRDYLRAHMDTVEPFARTDCPGADGVFAWSSPAPRAQASTRALLDALFPGCGAPYGHVRSVGDDGLFHPVRARRVRLDPVLAQRALQAAIGGDVRSARARYADDIDRMAALAGVPPRCTDPPCGLAGLQWRIVARPHRAGLAGALAVGATMSETIRMQYVDGWPLHEVGFGAVHAAADVSRLMTLRAAKYALVDNVRYLARRGGSQLMSEVLAAIASDRATLGDASPLAARLVLYVGHDGNIAQLRTLLGFDWRLPGYPPNDPVPGGTLMFERWRDRLGKVFVRVRYVAQSLAQLRELRPLDDKETPLVATFSPDGAEPGGMVPRERFNALVSHGIDWSATEPQSYPPLAAATNRRQ